MVLCTCSGSFSSWSRSDLICPQRTVGKSRLPSSVSARRTRVDTLGDETVAQCRNSPQVSKDIQSFLQVSETELFCPLCNLIHKTVGEVNLFVGAQLSLPVLSIQSALSQVRIIELAMIVTCQRFRRGGNLSASLTICDQSDLGVR